MDQQINTLDKLKLELFLTKLSQVKDLQSSDDINDSLIKSYIQYETEKNKYKILPEKSEKSKDFMKYYTLGWYIYFCKNIDISKTNI